jgi:hypothetical protein
LTILARDGQADKIMRVKAEMDADRVTPNIFTDSAMITCFAHMGNAKQALGLLISAQPRLQQTVTVFDERGKRHQIFLFKKKLFTHAQFL